MKLKQYLVRSAAFVGVFGTITVGVPFYIFLGPVESAPAPAELAVQASVARVAASATNLWQSFSGRFEAVEVVDLRARTSGAVSAIHFVEGALVREGDLLVQIDPAPYHAEVERLTAQLAASEARLSFARSERRRADALWRSRTTTERERDQRLNAESEAEASVRMAQAALSMAQLSLDYTQVRAPISGRVGRRDITVGNLVDAGPSAPVLTTIVSVSPIYASFEADEGAVLEALAHIGGDRSLLAKVPVEADVGRNQNTITGTLQLVDNRVDSRAGTVRLRASFDNSNDTLIPGQFARLRLGQAKQETVVLVPEQAVGTDQTRRFVMVLGTDNRAVRRDVELGTSLGNMRVVASGLADGERIVVNNLQRVRAGTLVEARDVTTTNAVASNR